MGRMCDLKPALALVLSLFLAASLGCQQSKPGSSKPSQTVPNSKTLEPVKRAMESVEDEVERRQEAKKEAQEKELERLDDVAESISDQVGELRDVNDWEGMVKALDQLVETRAEFLRYVQQEGIEKKLCSAHRRLGYAYEKRGKLAQAETHYQESLRFARDDNDRRFVYSCLCRLYQRFHLPEKALEIAKIGTPLAKDREDLTEWRLAPAEIALELEQFDRCQELAQAYLEEVKGDTTIDGLEAQEECYGLMGDVAWKRKEKVKVAELRRTRAELRLRIANLKLEQARAKQKSEN